MGRLVWSQVRFRPARALALLVGVLVAATAFTVLTAASRTAQLRTVGTVRASYRSAYDILVRPRGARTRLETQTGTVQPNFLSGIYGGITLSQYHRIERIPGVQVAAPIAMVGYAMIHLFLPVDLPATAYARPGRQLYRYETTWVSAGGSSRVAQPPSYLYLTPNRISVSPQTGGSAEVLPGGGTAVVCPPLAVETVRSGSGGVSGTRAGNLFGPAGQSTTWCWSKRDGLPGNFVGEQHRGRAFATVDWSFPVLIAAVDPVAEAKLDGLNRAVTSGRYLAERASAVVGANGQPMFPVLAAASSGIGEDAVVRVQRLAEPAKPPTLNLGFMRRESDTPGDTVLTATVSAAQAYRQVLHLMRNAANALPVDAYWSAGPTNYRRGPGGTLTALRIHNPPSVWQPAVPTTSLLSPPMDETDTQYRRLESHWISADSSSSSPEARLVGVFDPDRVRVFNPLSQVPLGPFQPVVASAADRATRKLLGGRNLAPNLNLGGYVSQPVQLITTLSALPALDRSPFSGDLHASDPISAIRVRVAGVTGPNGLSRERINEVAQQIAVRTRLDVDIVVGSSPKPTTIDLPPGRVGQPALQITEGWVKKGVAVTILSAVDKKSVVLFVLILVVCALFVANAATAAIRGRRRELGVLASTGWSRGQLFAVSLGELAGLGLVAGLLGAAAAVPLSAALGLHVSVERAFLAVPVAVVVAVLSGLAPAWLAATASPVASVRPPVLDVGRTRHPGGITGMALLNVTRAPGRTALGVVSLAVGIAALTVLTAVTVAFRGVVVGSLLGDAVAVQIRGVDYVAVVATLALGVLAVADVVVLNIRERAGELAVLRSFGWPESSLTRLVATEGAAVGLLGSLVGAGLGLGCAAVFAGQLPPSLYIAAAVAVGVGVGLTAVAALVPAQMLRQLPTPRLLAEE